MVLNYSNPNISRKIKICELVDFPKTCYTAYVFTEVNDP